MDTCRKDREETEQRLANAFRKLAQSLDGSGDNEMFYEKIIDQMPPVAVTRAMEQSPPAEKGNQVDDEPYRKPMVPKHTTLIALWNEWNGLEEYSNVFGGVAGREKTFGPKWRNRGMVNMQHFSRTKRIVEAIRERSTSKQISPLEVVAEWEHHFQTISNCSVSNFVKALKQLGCIKERAPRFKKKNNTGTKATTE
jgi:Transcriptional activator of glycolytic enzymes